MYYSQAENKHITEYTQFTLGGITYPPQWLAQATLEQLISFSDDGAGAETADSGNSTLEREFQISLVEKAQINLEQTQQALARLEAKTYGLCDNCGKPIGKLRLQEANPYATLCIECKELADRGL